MSAIKKGQKINTEYSTTLGLLTFLALIFLPHPYRDGVIPNLFKIIMINFILIISPVPIAILQNRVNLFHVIFTSCSPHFLLRLIHVVVIIHDRYTLIFYHEKIRLTWYHGIAMNPWLKKYINMKLVNNIVINAKMIHLSFYDRLK